MGGSISISGGNLWTVKEVTCYSRAADRGPIFPLREVYPGGIEISVNSVRN